MKSKIIQKTVWIVVYDSDDGHLTWAFASEVPARQCEERLMRLNPHAVTCEEQDLLEAFDESEFDGMEPRVWP